MSEKHAILNFSCGGMHLLIYSGHHPNLISLVGVITKDDPLVIVLSYAEHGALTSYLQLKVKNGTPLHIDAKLKLGVEIARGMQYLAMKHFIHRDLGGRNVLVKTGIVAQVADFG